MPSHRTRRTPGAVGWAFAFFLSIQVALNFLLDGRYPAAYDQEFAARLATLQARQAEAPGRPLLLTIGSSRTELSYRPESVPPLRDAIGRQPLLFNFSHMGAGPVTNLVEFRRLLRQGIRPEWVVLEIMPPYLCQEHSSDTGGLAEAGDLPLLWHHLSDAAFLATFLKQRAVPVSRYRTFLCSEFVPALTLENRPEATELVPGLGGHAAWLPVRETVSAEQLAINRADTRDVYWAKLQRFRICPGAIAAIRQTLELGRQQGVHFVLLLSPESSEFRSWYPPGTSGQVRQCIEPLGREYEAPLVDATTWLPDEDFCDLHHVLRSGQEHFTRRLAEEVLEPLVRGKLKPLAVSGNTASGLANSTCCDCLELFALLGNQRQ